MKKILLPLMVLIMVLGLALVPATPAALADDDPEVCLSSDSPSPSSFLVLTGFGGVVAGLFHLTVGGVPYDGWCANPGLSIWPGWCFNAFLVDAPRAEPWCKVAYIMTNFSPYSVAPSQQGGEAAAIQLAIWKSIFGKESMTAPYFPGIEARANAIYAEAETFFVCPSAITLVAEENPVVIGGIASQDWTATVIGSGYLAGIAVEFTTFNGSFSSTAPPVTWATDTTDATGKATVKLYWDVSLVVSITATIGGEWPVIIEPAELKPDRTEIQPTLILQPWSLDITKYMQPPCLCSIEIKKTDDVELGVAKFWVEPNPYAGDPQYPEAYLEIQEGDPKDESLDPTVILLEDVPCRAAPDVYKVTEKVPPAEYGLPDPAFIEESVTNCAEATVFEFTDPCLCSIEIKKTDDVELGVAKFWVEPNPYAGDPQYPEAYLEIQEGDPKDESPDPTVILLEDVPCRAAPDVYKVTEKVPPAEYGLPDPAFIEESVTNCAEATVFEFTDPCLCSIEIKKTDDVELGVAKFWVEPNPYAGDPQYPEAYLEIQEGDPKDESPDPTVILLEDVPCRAAPDVYKVTEKVPPAEYGLPDPAFIEESVTNCAEATPFEFTDPCLCSIEIKKTDDVELGVAKFWVEPNPYAGDPQYPEAYLEIQEGDPKDESLDPTVILLEDVPCRAAPDVYKVTEKVPPAEYGLPDPAFIEESVTNCAEATVFEFTDPCLCSIEIKKTDDVELGVAKFWVEPNPYAGDPQYPEAYLEIQEGDPKDESPDPTVILLEDVPCRAAPDVYKVTEKVPPAEYGLPDPAFIEESVTNCAEATVFEFTDPCLCSIEIKKTDDVELGVAKFWVEPNPYAGDPQYPEAYLEIQEGDPKDESLDPTVILLEDVPCRAAPDVYKVTEKVPPAEYGLPDPAFIEESVTNCAEATPFEFTDPCLCSIEIKKTDDVELGVAKFWVEPNPYAGDPQYPEAYLEIQEGDPKDESPDPTVILLEDVPCRAAPDVYKVTEKVPPAEYGLPDPAFIEESVTNCAEATPFEFTDPCLCSIEIKKTDDVELGVAKFWVEPNPYAGDPQYPEAYLEIQEGDPKDESLDPTVILLEDVPCRAAPDVYKVTEKVPPAEYGLPDPAFIEESVTNCAEATVFEFTDPPRCGANIKACKFFNRDCQSDVWVDEPIPGWTIYLYAGGDPQPGDIPLQVKTTGADGCVIFEDLAAGTYTVVEEQRSGWIQCTNPPLSTSYVVIITQDDVINYRTIDVDESGKPLSFGNWQDVSIEVVKTALLCGEGEGCTPGYWKNHEEDWPPTDYITTQRVDSVFTVPSCSGQLDELADDTLLEALNYGGGDDVLGMAQNLLRIAVAALLNAAHPGINYPHTVTSVIDDVNEALASCDRDTMETLKNELDADNNLGCHIGEDPANRGDGCCPDCCPGEDPLDVNVGDTVMYCYEVTNTSVGVTLTNVILVDDMGTLLDPSDDVTIPLDKTTLGPGESANGTLGPVVVEGSVTNTATATGTLPDGTKVTGTDTCTINVGTVQIGATITGHKYATDDCVSGTRVPVEGWTIELWKLNLSDGTESKVATTLTDEFGKFTFEDVAAGIYKVVEEQRLPDWVPCIILPLRTSYMVIVTGVDATAEAIIAVDVYGYALLFANIPPCWPWPACLIP